MSCGSIGCCCGIIVGFILALLLSAAAAFGIYCYFTPEAREQGRAVLVMKWSEFKDSGDQLVEKVGRSEEVVPVAEEPEVVL